MAYARLIGAEVKRKEDPRLITGSGSYVGDLKLPGMQHVAFLRSPYAHATIKHIDATAALKLPGVVAVITGKDLPELCGPMPIASAGEGGDGSQVSPRTRYALSIDRVRYVGEPVAAVIATSEAIAVDALEAIEVDWEPLPAVADVLEAIAEGAPQIFTDAPGNVDSRRERKSGDPDAAFADAHKIVRQRMHNQRLVGFPMEGRAVAVAPEAASDGLTVWNSTQTPHSIRSELAKILGMVENRIRVIAPDVGGGFGVKIGVYAEDVLLAVLVKKFRVPLRWVEQRMEHMISTTHGRAQVADMEAAVAADGTITALRMRLIGDLGAYPLAPFIPGLTMSMAVGVYKIPNVDLAIQAVFTNTTPVAAYRGAGRPEAAYYLERLMDLVAVEMNMDPAEIRRNNFIPPDAFPYKTPTGLTYDSGDYDQPLTRALELADYPALRAEQQRRRTAGGPLLGIGIACYVEMCGFGPYESAQIRIEPGGSVTVSTGISPHGQGTGTTFAQIVADKLGADFDQIIVRYSDTAVTPMGRGTQGSRSLAVGGSALVRAADKVYEKARKIAAHMLEANPDDIELHEGKYQVRGAPQSSVSLVRIAAQAFSAKLPPDIDAGLEASEFFRPPGLIYPFGAHLAVVEVDPETGDIRLLNYYSVDDCGPRMSPIIVAGQVHGGLAQGIAQALIEEAVYDKGGQLLSGSLMDYALPRAELFPKFTLAQTETPTPLNPLGVKGIGEAATIGSTPAIVNAVMNALAHLGVRHIDMPLRPEKIWRAVQQ
jgi:carbon-monoxide dehydrogenase large subunit